MPKAPDFLQSFILDVLWFLLRSNPNFDLFEVGDVVFAAGTLQVDATDDVTT